MMRRVRNGNLKAPRRNFTSKHILGVSQNERERLNIQHNHFKPLLLNALRKAPIAQEFGCESSTINVLDVGFGPGDTLNELHQYYNQEESDAQLVIHGIDNDTDWHNYVQSNNHFQAMIGDGSLHLYNLDVSDPSSFGDDFMNNNEFNVIFIRFVMAFINPSKIRNTLMNLCKLLKNGGHIIIQEPMPFGSFGAIYPKNEALESCMDKLGMLLRESEHFNDQAPLEVASVLRNDCNLKIIDQRSVLFGGLNGDAGFECAMAGTKNLINGLHRQQRIDSKEKDEMCDELWKLEKMPNSALMNSCLISTIARKESF